MTGTLTSPSDQKLKQQIKQPVAATDKIMRLKPVEYYYNTSKYSYMSLPATKQTGFLAQDMEQVIPELVTTNIHPKNEARGLAENMQYKSINYIGLVPILTKAIQEQQIEIDALKSDLQDKNEELHQLKKRLDQVEILLQNLKN